MVITFPDRSISEPPDHARRDHFEFLGATNGVGLAPRLTSRLIGHPKFSSETLPRTLRAWRCDFRADFRCARAQRSRDQYRWRRARTQSGGLGSRTGSYSPACQHLPPCHRSCGSWRCRLSVHRDRVAAGGWGVGVAGHDRRPPDDRAGEYSAPRRYAARRDMPTLPTRPSGMLRTIAPDGRLRGAYSSCATLGSRTK